MKFVQEVASCRFRCCMCKKNVSGLGFMYETRIGCYKVYCRQCDEFMDSPRDDEKEP